ncbi:MAG: hypothetical protein WKG07_24970, partial [Hymenobacter sp.]
MTKSTVPPSTVATKVKPHVDELNRRYNKPIGLASNPEFLREGYAWDDLHAPRPRGDWRGGRAIERTAEPGVSALQRAPIHYVTYNSAGVYQVPVEHAAVDAYRFSNEMAMITSTSATVDVASAFKILHQDKRWTRRSAASGQLCVPGCGYGGYCLPKDTAALEQHCAGARLRGQNPQRQSAHQRGKLLNTRPTKSWPPPRLESRIGILGSAFKSGSRRALCFPASS